MKHENQIKREVLCDQLIGCDNLGVIRVWIIYFVYFKRQTQRDMKEELQNYCALLNILWAVICGEQGE